VKWIAIKLELRLPESSLIPAKSDNLRRLSGNGEKPGREGFFAIGDRND